MNDAAIAQIARELAHALMDRAYSRSADDNKRVAAGEHALCKAVREEEMQRRKDAAR